MGKQTFFFDMDGTLLDSMFYWMSLKWRICDNYYKRTNQKIILTKEETKKLESLSVRGAVNYINRCHNTKIDYNLDCMESLRRFYLKECKLKPGVLKMLETCRKNKIKMAVLTATPKDIAIEALSACGIRDYFSFVLSPKQVKGGKFHRPFFVVACLLARAFPKNCVLIDDADYAHKTAKKLGIRTIGIYDQYRDNILDDICDESFENFSELYDYYVKNNKL